MKNERDRLKKYDIGVKEIKEVDLRNCYMQQRPNSSIGDLLLDKGMVNSFIINSPHYEIACLYYKEGESWLRKHYKDTKYFTMMTKYFDKKNFYVNHTLINFFKSIKGGYRRGKYKNSYISVLLEPFANSRYNRNVPNLVPEIFSGHHRAAALLALKIYKVKVIVATDLKTGSCKTNGKIHNLCIK